MIEFRQAGKHDIQRFSYDGVEKDILREVDITAQLEAYAKAGHMWVTVKDNELIAMYGLIDCSPKVQQCWMLFNQAAGKHTKSILKEMKAILQATLKHEAHRIQTYLFVGDQGSKYLKILGFKKEAVLKSFGPQREDAEVWAVIS